MSLQVHRKVIYVLFCFLMILNVSNLYAESIVELIESFNRVTQFGGSGWKWAEGDIQGAERADFNDSDWNALGRGRGAELRGMDYWLRNKVEIPPLLNNVEIRMSIELIGKGTLYVNGERIGDFSGRKKEFVITPGAEIGDTFVIALRSEKATLIGGAVSRFDAETIDAATELSTLLSFIQLFRDDHIAAQDKYDVILEEYMSSVDLNSYREGNTGRFLRSLRKARPILNKLDPLMKEYTIYVCGHSHVDLAWRWDYEETKRRLESIFANAVQLMDRYPEYTFAQDQTRAFDFLEGSALWEKIKKYVAEGRLGIIGGMVTLPDCAIPSGEAFIRQNLYGKRWFKEKFGVDVKVAWNLDPGFGSSCHVWTLPQILKKSGLKYYVQSRSVSSNISEYWWEGPDGSRVLGYNVKPSYMSGYQVEPRRIMQSVSAYLETSNRRSWILLDGLDCTIPSQLSVENYEKLAETKPYPKIQFSTPSKFFEEMEQDIGDIPVIKTELRDPVRPPERVRLYINAAETKKNNRLGENLLASAEKAAAIADRLGYSYPKEGFVEAWTDILHNQMHDILPGTCIAEVYQREVPERYEKAFSFARSTIEKALRTLAQNVDMQGEGIPILIFNPLGWERTETVNVELTLPGTHKYILQITDAAGKRVPVQVNKKIDWNEYSGTGYTGMRIFGAIYWDIQFLAEMVPSMGYKVFYAQFNQEPAEILNPKTSLFIAEDGSILENEYFRVTIDHTTGYMDEIFDKKNDRHVLSPGSQGNVLEIFSLRGLRSSAGPPQTDSGIPQPISSKPHIEVIERGPARGVVRITRTFQNSTVTQDIMLYSQSDCIDCHTRMDWHDVNVLLKAALPVSLKDGKATYEISYGAMERPEGGDWIAQKWIDLSNENYGISFLNNGRYSYDIMDGKTMRLTLLQNVYGNYSEGFWGTLEPLDEGKHEITYSFYPHKGDWREANTVRKGYELNNPLIVIAARPHPGKLPRGRLSFVTVEPEHVILSVMKQAEDTNDLILRLHESTGNTSKTTIRTYWNIADADEMDMIEWEKVKPISHTRNMISLSMSPWEIKTVRVILEQ